MTAEETEGCEYAAAKVEIVEDDTAAYRACNRVSKCVCFFKRRVSQLH